jgi:hypothetical protein
MKRSFTSLFLLAVCFFLLESFGGDGNLKRSTGSPGGYTNSPGDGKTCTNCHGSAVAVTGWVTSNVPASGYVPGTVYQITVTATSAGTNKGFECSPQTPAGALVGTVAAGTGMKLTNSNKAVTHNAVVSSNPAVWTFNWTAPATGVGNVTFYSAICIGENYIRTTTLVIPQASGIGIEEKNLVNYNLYPNPVVDKINIAYSLNKSDKVTVDLYSLDGRFISTLTSGLQASGNHLMDFDLPAGTSKGVYLLQVTAGGEKKQSRVVVQ